ncbi:MAG: DUF3857 and transglutaminase domain-containing protein [Candidatus Latescibacteria bacterium]|nr:DUF3857 and transglutaminase domain-containing protein [Candidatus Latescibacterota bacterium]
MKPRSIRIILFAFLCLFGSILYAQETDVLYTKKGEEYVGRLIEISENRVVFQHGIEGRMEFDLSDVQRVELGKSRTGDAWRTVGDIKDETLLNALAIAPPDSAYPHSGYLTLYQEATYRLHEDGSVRITKRKIQKVFKERGKRVANNALYYMSDNSNAQIDFGRTVTAEGDVIPISDAAIQDGSVFSQYPDYQNLNKKHSALKKVKEGSVIDYQTTMVVERTDFLHPFLVDVSFGDREPILRKTLKVIVPKGVECAYQMRRFGTDEPSSVEETGDGSLQYTWTLEHTPEMIAENFMPETEDLWPRVAFAPKAQWADLSRKYAGILEEHLKGSPSLKEKVAEIVKGVKNKTEAARALYTYMVKQIRTIPVPYNLYSLIPKDIVQTYQKKYGNNLDKSLLFLGLLREAGITAHLCLIVPQSEGALMEEVPSLGHFSDCLVRIAVEDTLLYAGVLDETIAFGALDADYQNVRGLIIDQAHPELVTTPLLDAEGEAKRRSVEVVISADGTFIVRDHTRYTGQSAAQVRTLKVMRADELKKIFQEAVGRIHPNAELLSYQVSDLDDLSTPVEITTEYRIRDYALQAGKSLMVFQLPDLEYSAYEVGKATRIHPLDWSHRTLETNQYTLALPDGFDVYHLPGDVRYDTPLITYQARFEQKNGGIRFTDASTRKAVFAPAGDYLLYKKGIEAKAKLAKEWVVLERK